MNSRKNLATQVAGAIAIAALMGTSAFAETRHLDATDHDHARQSSGDRSSRYERRDRSGSQNQTQTHERRDTNANTAPAPQTYERRDNNRNNGTWNRSDSRNNGTSNHNETRNNGTWNRNDSRNNNGTYDRRDSR